MELRFHPHGPVGWVIHAAWAPILKHHMHMYRREGITTSWALWKTPQNEGSGNCRHTKRCTACALHKQHSQNGHSTAAAIRAPSLNGLSNFFGILIASVPRARGLHVHFERQSGQEVDAS